MFYLDTANPANCTGNITSWRVCYYGPDSINNVAGYWATYAVYQRMGSEYMRASEMFRAVRADKIIASLNPAVDGKIAQGGFNCYTDSIDAGDVPLIVHAGDIVGACIFDPEDYQLVIRVPRRPLDVVGEARGETLLGMGTDGCSMDDIPSNISANQLSILNSRRLHIHANIGKLY